MQPIVSDDVAAALADVAIEDAAERHGRTGRPRTDPHGRTRPTILERKPGRTQVVTDVHARYFGTELNDQSPHPGRQPAHRPDAFRGLAQPLHTSKLT